MKTKHRNLKESGRKRPGLKNARSPGRKTLNSQPSQKPALRSPEYDEYDTKSLVAEGYDDPYSQV